MFYHGIQLQETSPILHGSNSGFRNSSGMQSKALSFRECTFFISFGLVHFWQENNSYCFPWIFFAIQTSHCTSSIMSIILCITLWETFDYLGERLLGGGFPPKTALYLYIKKWLHWLLFFIFFGCYFIFYICL